MATPNTGLPVQSQLSRQHTDPLRDFKFLVHIGHEVLDGPNTNASVTKIGFTLGFTSVGGFSASTNAIPYRQGGYNTTTQMIPGQTSYNPITLQRGLLLGTPQNFNWFKQIFSVQVGQGNYAANGDRGFRSNLTVYVLPHPRTDTTALDAVAKIKVFNAWPTSISYSDLNAGDNAFIVEQVTLAHEGWDLTYLSDSAFGNSESVYKNNG